VKVTEFDVFAAFGIGVIVGAIYMAMLTTSSTDNDETLGDRMQNYGLSVHQSDFGKWFCTVGHIRVGGAFDTPSEAVKGAILEIDNG
jgi:hypothetical protein